MDKITVDGDTFNPYFMLDVVPEDDEAFITKSFRKKAKMWHPDKIKDKDPKKIIRAKQHFKILVNSYEYIINKKRSVNHSKKREYIEVPTNNNLQSKSIDNSNELDMFNQEFEKLHVKNPNDFGYETDPRIADPKEYENFTYKPYQLFNSKQFNRNEFNKVFEYQQKHHGGDMSNQELAVYHKTTDGFNAYNSGELGNAANVSSYNGLMIVGDNYGQAGVGYYDTQYSDYKKTFAAPKNPENIVQVPDDFIPLANRPIQALTKNETQKQIELQMQHRRMDLMSSGGNSKQNFRLQEQMLLEKQQQDMQDKIEMDKQMILQYQDMYNDKSLIQAALDNRLLTSKDYVDEKSFDKRFQRTNV